MADQWPDPFFSDGNFNVPVACGLPVFSSPVHSTSAEYSFTQEWIQSRKSFSATTLGTGHPSSGKTPDYSAWKLVQEGPRQDIGGGLVKWQRTYAKPPATHDEYETYSYPFIGWTGVWTDGNIASFVTATGRPRKAFTVTSRVQHDYFLTGPGQTYLTAGLIPTVKAQAYYAGATPGPSVPLYTDFISDLSGSFPATSPDRTAYNAWVANANTLSWASGVAPSGTSPGQLVAEDSRLSRWSGPIFLRQTRYVLAI